MDVIILGVYSVSNKETLNNTVAAISNLEIVWNYEQYNIEAFKGIKVLEESYKLFQTGILVEKDRDKTFSSYPLVYEVSDVPLGGNPSPKLFQFFKSIEKSDIDRMIIAFANEWEKDTLVRIEKYDFQGIKKRLNSVFVWCENYTNLINNTEVRDDCHPLILELESSY